MMNKDPNERDNHWQIIKLAEFERPSAPASTRIEQLVQHLRNLFLAQSKVQKNLRQKTFTATVILT